MKQYTLAILIFIGIVCLSVGHFSIAVFAQLASQAPQPAVSLPAEFYKGPIPGGYLVGYVLDEDGNPVPDASVSLLQEGQLWDPGMYNYPENGRNPQRTRIAYYDTDDFLKEGSFLFGIPLPDDYTLEAEKVDYKGNTYKGYTNVHVPKDLMYQGTNDSMSKAIMVNISLKGYHEPAFTPEQLSNTGAIVGKILNVSYHTTIFNVSLLQDGHLVILPYNPQPPCMRNYYLPNVRYMNVDYIFEHLAPGRYSIMVEYDTDSTSKPPMYTDTITVDVGHDVVVTDIILSHVSTNVLGPTSIPTPTIEVIRPSPVSTSSVRPSPSFSHLISIFTICLATSLILKKKL